LKCFNIYFILRAPVFKVSQKSIHKIFFRIIEEASENVVFIT